MNLQNVRIRDGGVVHKRRFSWVTACGKSFSDGSILALNGFAGDTDDPATCLSCKNAKPNDYDLEMGLFGASINCLARVPDEYEWVQSLYEIAVVSPPFISEGTKVFARLASDKHAIDLALTLLSWHVVIQKGELFCQPDQAYEWLGQQYLK